MLGMGRRTFRKRHIGLFFCVCLLSLPPVHFAKVFPNDLVPRLSRYRPDSYSYEETADSNSDSSRLLSPSPRISSLSEKVLNPRKTSLIPFSYPYILQKSIYGNERLFRQLYDQDSLESEVPQAVLTDTEAQTLEDRVYDSFLSEDEFRPSDFVEADPWVDSPDRENQPAFPSAPDDALALQRAYQQENPIEYYDYDSKEELYDQTDRRRKEQDRLYDEPPQPNEATKAKPDPVDDKSSYHVSYSTNAQKEESKSQPPCRYCRLREEDRNHRIESLKRMILQRLNMVTFPNRTGLHIPRALVHMDGIGPDLLQSYSYGSVHYTGKEAGQDDSEEEQSLPNRIIILAKSLPVTLHSGKENVTYFPMPTSVQQSKVTKADLWFYVNHSSDAGSGVTRVRVDLLAPSLSKRRSPLSTIAVWKGLADPNKDNGWQRVDLTQVIQGWARDPSTNHGLKILAYDKRGNTIVLHPISTAEKGYEPTLDIVTTHKDSRQRRKRSDSLICTENSTEHRCCRYPLHLSFMDYKWDWVIAPTHMEVGYCSGECHMTLQNETPHSWFIAQARSSGSCCTPSKMMAMPLLYINHEGDIVHQLLQDMRVERCGCA